MVIGNYPADHQQSMQRVADLLCQVYRSKGFRVRLVNPPVLCARFHFLPAIVRKYLGYIDKLFVFPLWLVAASRAYDLVHIADHSNSFYSFCIKPARCILICHDLLAMRGAMGDPRAFCEASTLGIWLQRLIKAGLRRPAAVSFISQATCDDFQKLIGLPPGQRQAVTHLPLNAPFRSEAASNTLHIPDRLLLPPLPFLLMVGSALPRKNRALALSLLEHLAVSSSYHLVFAGESLTDAEQLFKDSHPLGNLLISIVAPSHQLLNVLYCQAHALLFPSFSEGFGWPVIEAQACGCPVIASTTTSIPEVAGEGALYANPTDVSTYLAHIRALEDPKRRAWLVQRGFSNCQRFTPERFAEAITTFAFPP